MTSNFVCLNNQNGVRSVSRDYLVDVHTNFKLLLQRLAWFMKKVFEDKYKSNWHCVVGKLSSD